MGTGTFKSSMLCQGAQSLRAWRTQPSGALARDFRVRPMWSETEVSIKSKWQQQNVVNLDRELVYSFFLKGKKKGIFQCTLYLKASPNSIVILLNLNKTASADYQPKHRPYMPIRVVQLLKHSGI